MARFEVFRSGRRVSEITLAPPELVIGRDASAAIRLDDRLVSRRHARVLPADGAWVVEDLDTRNGTFVNGVREYRRALRDGDRLEFGAWVLTFHQPAGERVPSLAAAAAPCAVVDPDAPRVYEAPARKDTEATTGLDARSLARIREEARTLMGPHLVESGPPPRTHALRHDRVVLGAAETCTLRLPATGRDESAALERGADGSWTLRRLGFFAKVRLNGARVKEAKLRAGDRLELGDAVLVFEPGAPRDG